MSGGRILVAESNSSIENCMRSVLQKYGDCLDVIKWESHFDGAIERYEKSGELPLKLAVINPFLLWAPPAEDTPVPPTGVMEGGAYEGGLRCFQRLREGDNKKSAGITPVIFFGFEKNPDDYVRKVEMYCQGSIASPKDFLYVGWDPGVMSRALPAAIRRALQS